MSIVNLLYMLVIFKKMCYPVNNIKSQRRLVMLSVILPAYNEQEMISTAAGKISSVLAHADIDYELIFVNDGSTDSTWREISAAAEKDKNVRGLSFSRNFGKESAILAGLANAEGNCSVVIDCDLQHPPEKIVDMYRLWQQGYEVIEGVKADRGKESAFHRFCVKCFYKVMGGAMRTDMSRASDFKLLDRKVVAAILNMGERNMFFRALSSWVGYKTATVEFEVQERAAGESKWSSRALFKYAVSNITGFSSVPLHFVTVLGGVTLAVSVILGVIALVQKFTGQALGGFTTVIILQLFIGSIIMISLGIIGHYISRIYEEVKCRPRYIISNTCGKAVDNEKNIG